MSTQDLQWLFSTIAQTLGAIVGIIGMLTVYKLQTIANYMKESMEETVQFRRDFFGMESYSQTPDQFVENWPQVKEGLDDVMTQKRKVLDRLAIDLTRLSAARNQLISRFFLFLIPNLSFVVLSILGLLYCHSLAPMGTMIAVLTGIAMLFTFCSTIYLCYSLIKS